VFSGLDKDHGEGALTFCESSKIHEGALGEFVDSEIPKPYIESFVFLV